MTIAVGMQARPSAAPQMRICVSGYKLVASPRFADAIASVSSIVFAYADTPAFFSIVSEMREAPPIYQVVDHFPDGSNPGLSCHRMRRVLLLWLLCRIACPWLLVPL